MKVKKEKSTSKWDICGIILLSISFLVQACNNKQLECTNCDCTGELSQCPKCPEKICPACSSCEQAKPQDKPLIIELIGTLPPSDPFSKDTHYYNAYRIINPNERRVLVHFKNYCYNINNTERVFEETHFIDGKTEYYDDNGNHYFYASCHGDWHTQTFKSEIID